MSPDRPAVLPPGAARRRDRVRSARGPKPTRDPAVPLGHGWERERGVTVEEREVLTVFLAGAECPFTCLFCDLWQHTLEGPTPPGALPRQLREAIRVSGPIPAQAAVKLYNASNFFDPRAVPPEDDGELSALCGPFARVTVESHPAFLGDRCEAFAHRLEGRLEVALGLETVHPEVFPRLKDGMALPDFDRAARWCRDREIGVRAFVLVGLPWVAAADFVSWAARSVAHAGEAGADRASLIPLRAGSGRLARLSARGELEPVALAHLDAALVSALEMASGLVVEADLWDARGFARCEECAEARLARLAEMNRSQTPLPALGCACDAPAFVG